MHCCRNGILITEDLEELGFSSSLYVFSWMSCHDVSGTEVEKDYTLNKKRPEQLYENGKQNSDSLVDFLNRLSRTAHATSPVCGFYFNIK